jgi:hypothetical protein
VLRVIDLKMRQLPAIKSLRHVEIYVGTAALGCPRSEAPQLLILGPRAYRSKVFYEELERICSKLGIPSLARKASFTRPDSRWRLSPHGIPKSAILLLGSYHRGNDLFPNSDR